MVIFNAVCISLAEEIGTGSSSVILSTIPLVQFVAGSSVTELKLHKDDRMPTGGKVVLSIQHTN